MPFLHPPEKSLKKELFLVSQTITSLAKNKRADKVKLTPNSMPAPNTFKKFFLYFTLFTSGAVILIVEIAGTRVLSPFYGSSIFVWSSLITITLGFLALGYFTGGFLADKYPKRFCFYFIIFLGGASALFLIKLNQPLLVFSDGFGLKWGPLVASSILFALPLFLLGMAGPFAIRLRSRQLEKAGHTSGFIFGISTLGSLTGALLTGFYLIPNFFLSSIFTVSAVIILITALIGLLLERAFWRTVIILAVVLILLILMPFLKYKDDSSFTIIHTEPSFYADLKVGEIMGNRCLFMDGAAQTCITSQGGVSLARYIAEIKRLSQNWPKDYKVLLLGLGGGGVVKALNKDFALDVVELDPKIAKLAEEYFSFTLDEDDMLIVDDARSYLRKTSKQYDVVIFDLYFGSAMPIHLYTKEVAELVKKRLTKRGVFISNIIGTLEGEDMLARSLIRTQAEVFPNLIVTTNRPAELSNILTHAFSDKAYNPSFKDRYKVQQVSDYKKAVIVVDARNPLDLLLIESLEELLTTVTKESFGYTSLFSI